MRCLLPEHFIIEVLCGSRLWIDNDFQATNERFSNRSGKTHVCVETHDQNGRHVVLAKPFLKASSGKRTEHVLLKELFCAETFFRPESLRQLRTPASRYEGRRVIRLVVVLDPGNRSLLGARATNMFLDR